MKIAPLPVNEIERLKSLNDYYILDTLPENDFINVVTIAAEICHVPTSMVCLVDETRHLIKSSNDDISIEIIKNFSLFSNNNEDEVLVIPNTVNDNRFSDKTFVIGVGEQPIMFYIHVPLFNIDLEIVGFICILDIKPHEISKGQIVALKSLSKQVVSLLALRKQIGDLKQTHIEQKSAYADLEKFSFVASHDLRSPLNNIISLTQLLNEDYAEKIDEDGKEYLNFLNNAANQLADLVSGILEYSRSSQLLIDNKELINIPHLINEVINLIQAPDNILISYNKADSFIFASKIALKQILMNLCDNAIKHNDKPKGIIEINFTEGKKYFTFEVKDNGPGIDATDQKRIFELFERVKKQTKEKDGIGVGLSIVKRLVEKSGGEVRVMSEPHLGTSFIFTILK